jgi:hypothetical protein
MSSVLIRYIEQSDFPVFLDLHLNSTTFLWAAILALIAVVLSGVLPGLRATGVDRTAILRSGQRTLAARKHRLGTSLLSLQVALSLFLASLALLFGVSAGELLSLDPGFSINNVTLFPVDFDRRAEKGEARVEFYRKVLDSLRNTAGVEGASVVAIPPLGGSGIDEGISLREERLCECRWANLFRDHWNTHRFGP